MNLIQKLKKKYTQYAATQHKKKQVARSQVIIVSFPKSGRTWLRVMIGKYICSKYGIDERKLLDTFKITSLAGIERTWFSHDNIDFNAKLHYSDIKFEKKRYRNKKIILMIREPKDVITSWYFHITRRKNRNSRFSNDISGFIRDPSLGIKKLIYFINVWNKNRLLPAKFELISYEEMHRQPANVLRKVLTIMDEEPDEALLTDAVNYGSFDNMKKLEHSNNYTANEGVLSARHMDDDESLKVRKGKVGGYSNYLSEADITYINEAVQNEGCEFLTRYLNKQMPLQKPITV